MSTIAVHSIDVEIGAVGLGREAVVIDVDPGALDVNGRNIHRVHEVSILRDDARVV